MIDISAGSISPSGYLVLQNDTSYNLFGNLVLDGTSFKGVSGGNEGTRLNGQGYTISITDDPYDASASFPTPIALSKLTLINPISTESWGFASPDATCYAFTGDFDSPTTVGVANIDSGDFYIHLSAGNQYTLSGNLDVSAGVFNGFMVEGPENVILDGAGYTVTMRSSTNGGLMSNDNQGASLLVKGLTVDASGVALANGKGWIFGTGFTNMIAVNCHVTCGDLDLNSGGIFGGGNTGFVCATGCSVVCGNSMNSGDGGGGGICGGLNGDNYGSAIISITDCTATITGSVTNGGGGGGGGMCGGANGASSGNATISITGCTATITGSVTNNSNGGGGGMCGGLNGVNSGIANITITGCSVTIEEDVTNNDEGGGGGMCGGYNNGTISITGCTATITGSVTSDDFGGGGGMCGGYNGHNRGTATIFITDCTATITGSVMNTGDGGSGGMCGGLNGAGGIANISITNCYADISGNIQFGSILGADMGNITLIPYSPYDLSLNGFTLGWVGGNDVSYNIYVDGVLSDLSGITGLSAVIASQLQYGLQFRVKSIYRGRESAFSDTIIYLPPPTDLSLNGTILSWNFPVDVSYNIYINGILRDLSGMTGRSAEIASQLQYGLNISVTAVYNDIESEQSDTYYVVPTDLSLNGTILSWKFPVDASYNIYVDGTLSDLTGMTGRSAEIASQLQYGLNISVTAVYNGDESEQSDTYNVVPTDLSLNGTILSWKFPVDASYDIYVGGILYDLSGITGLSADIASQLQYGIHFGVKAIYNGRESAFSNTVVSQILPQPTDISLNGTILSWKGPPDVSYNIYVDGVLRDIYGISGTSVDIFRQLGYGNRFRVSAIFHTYESTRSVEVVFMYNPIVVSIEDISPDDFYIHLSAGTQYTLSENLDVIEGIFNGFIVEGSGNVILDCSGHTITMTSEGGLMSNDGNTSLFVKHLVVDASGVALANGNGWIFGTGFTNMIAVNCHVTCGDLGSNSGGIFGGENTGFVHAIGCSVVCGTIANSGIFGGGGGMCGGRNNGIISITDCSATITGNVSNTRIGDGGGGGGMCGGANGVLSGTAHISITGCSATITGSVTNNTLGGGGGGGMCGGLNGFYGTAHISIIGCTTRITGNVTNAAVGGGGGGGMCGGYNGFSGNAALTIIGCTATITGDVTNTGGGGGGGMCGGYNGFVGGTATIIIIGCTATITRDVTNALGGGGGGGGGMCGGYNGVGGTATITITDCEATIGRNVTNESLGAGGGGGVCGGNNGLGGTATITITDCSVSITGNVSNTRNGGGGGGGICGGQNVFLTGTANISITGCSATITGSVTNNGFGGGGGICGGRNRNANISITDCFADISGVIKFGRILGADMVNILLIPYSPYDLSLNGSILKWIGGNDVSYNIYVGGILRDLSGITGLSAEIASQLQYGIRFSVKSIYSERLSAASQPIFYVPPPAPTDLSLNGTILSWTGIPDVSYSVNYVTTAGYTTITTQSDFSYNIQNYTNLNLTYFVQAIYGSSTSANSSTVTDTSVFSGSAVNLTTYIQAALDASSDITTLKETLVNNPSSFTSSITNHSGIDMRKFVSKSTTDVSSVNVTFMLPAGDISSSLLSPSGTYLYLLGDVNSTVIYTVDGSPQTVFFSTSSITVNGISTPLGGVFKFYTNYYTFVGAGSALIFPSSRPPPRKTKPISNKALRSANFFPSASMRTRVVAGSEIIRTFQSSSKRTFQSADTLTQIDAARAYLQGKSSL